MLKISQALSSEIELEKLIEDLLRTAIEHGGAQRGLLILPQGSEFRIEAEANTAEGAVTVRLREATPDALPEAVVRYSARTKQPVLLDDAAAARGPFADDDYIRRRRARSILCLPLIKQGKLVALLYLENNLAVGVFTPARMAVLNVLASQAAMSLENGRLYREVQQREAKIRRLVDANIVGVLITDLEGRIFEANEAFLAMVGYTRDDVASGRLNWMALTPPEWQHASQQAVVEVRTKGICELFEKEYFRSDGTRAPVLVATAAIEGSPTECISFVLDLSERKRAEEERERLRQAQAELERISRVTTVGQLTATLAHEINQPLSAVVANAGASLRWLGRPSPNLERAREALQFVLEAGERAGEIVARVRELVKKAPAHREPLHLNRVILEVVDLIRNDLLRNQVSLQLELSAADPQVRADKVQLQQVMLNLISNAVEAMNAPGVSARRLLISSSTDGTSEAVVAVHDWGPGFESGTLERVFDPFFTTKSHGMGMGLAISRAIVLAHGGRMWATPNQPRGATFQFLLPTLSSGSDRKA